MRFSRKRSHEFPINRPEEGVPVPIAGDAAISTRATGDGRLIPLLILDTRLRPDLSEAIRIQSSVPSGDVNFYWGHLLETPGRFWSRFFQRPRHVALFLSFVRPTNCKAVIQFDLEDHGILVETILLAKSMYIQSGKPGDRLIHNLDLPKMLLEVPDTGFRLYWDRMYRTVLIRRFRREGLTRNRAKAAVEDYLREVRKFVKFQARM